MFIQPIKNKFTFPITLLYALWTFPSCLWCQSTFTTSDWTLPRQGHGTSSVLPDRWALCLTASLGVVSPGPFKAPYWIIEFRLFLRVITSLLVQKAQDVLSSLNFQCFSLLAPISSTPRMNTPLICHFCCWILLGAQYMWPKGSESRTSVLCGSSWVDNHLSWGRNRYSSSTFCSLCHCPVLLCLSNKA